MTRSALFLAAAGLLASAAAAAPRGPTNIEAYLDLRPLLSRGFSCTRAVRPGGPMRPELWRLHNDWREQLDRVRERLVRIEGEERVAAAERSRERPGDDDHVHFTGPCSIGAATRARAEFRRRLLSLQPRLGLRRESQPRRSD